MATYNININLVLPQDATEEMKSNNITFKTQTSDDIGTLEDPIIAVSVEVDDFEDVKNGNVKSVEITFNADQGEDIRPVSIIFTDTNRGVIPFTAGNSDISNSVNGTNKTYTLTYTIENGRPSETSGSDLPATIRYKSSGGNQSKGANVDVE